METIEITYESMSKLIPNYEGMSEDGKRIVCGYATTIAENISGEDGTLSMYHARRIAFNCKRLYDEAIHEARLVTAHALHMLT